jgi:hypothetical protein
MYTEQLTQGLAVVGYLPPQSLGTGTNTTITNIDLKKYHRLLVVIQTGSLGTSATVDAKLREAKTSGGTYQDISGKSITQLVKASNDNNLATIEVRADELDAGYEFVQLSLTVGTAASQVAALALAGEANHKPANAGNLASVVQQVA